MILEKSRGEVVYGLCHKCNKNKGRILIITKNDLVLCEDCALQVSRYLIEDLCELKGDKHG